MSKGFARDRQGGGRSSTGRADRRVRPAAEQCESRCLLSQLIANGAPNVAIFYSGSASDLYTNGTGYYLWTQLPWDSNWDGPPSAMAIGKDSKGILTFNLANLGSGAQVSQAILTLRAPESDSGDTVNVSWFTPQSGSLSASDYYNTPAQPAGSFTDNLGKQPPDPSLTYQVDVTAAIKAWEQSHTGSSIVFRLEDSGKGATFWTDFGGGVGAMDSLTIDYNSTTFSPQSLNFNTSQGGANLTYNVSGSPSPQNVNAALYWSNVQDPLSKLPASALALATAGSVVIDPSTGDDLQLAVPPTSIDGSLGTHTLPFAASAFTTPPPIWARYLVAKIDPEQRVVTDVDAATTSTAYTPTPPTVKILTSPSSPIKGQPFTISLAVTNNDPVPQKYATTWAEAFAPPLQPDASQDGATTGPEVDKQGTLSIGLVQPGQTNTVTAPIPGSFTHTWDWIPKNQPLLAETTGKAIQKALKAYANQWLQESYIQRAAGNIMDLTLQTLFVNQSSTITSQIKKLLVPVQSIPTATSTFTATVYSDDSGTPHAESTPVQPTPITISVSPEHINNFNIAMNTLADAESHFADATSYSAFTDPTRFEADIMGAIGEVLTAGLAYQSAVDPPDPNYTTIAAPAAISVPEVESMPSGPAKDYALASLQYLSLRTAQSTAQNRADGAAAAGDVTWQAKQLLAAASDGLAAAAVENQLPGLYALANPTTSGAPAPVDPAVYYSNNGLPAVATQLLTQFGWTADQITALTDALIQRGQVSEDGPQLVEEYDKVVAATALVSSQDELAQAIQLQVSGLGQPVSSLTPQQSQDLNADAQTVQNALTQSTTPDAAGAAIQAYYQKVLDLAATTNNLSALQPALNASQSALEQLEATRTDAGPALTLIDNSANGGTSNGGTSNTIPASTAGPIVSKVEVRTVRHRISTIIITFNKPVASMSAGTTSNYGVHLQTRGGRTKNGVHQAATLGRAVAISSVTYDPSGPSVTLALRKPLPSNQVFQLSVNGGTGGVTDQAGNPLNRPASGGPGTSFVDTLK